LLEQAGFEVICAEVETDERALRDLREGRVRPHPAFSAYTPEELAGELIDVFGRVPG